MNKKEIPIQLKQNHYTLLHNIFRMFFANIIGLPGLRNKRKSVLEITKMYYFKIQII